MQDEGHGVVGPLVEQAVAQGLLKQFPGEVLAHKTLVPLDYTANLCMKLIEMTCSREIMLLATQRPPLQRVRPRAPIVVPQL